MVAPRSAAAFSDLMGYPAHSWPAGGSQSHVNLHRVLNLCPVVFKIPPDCLATTFTSMEVVE